MRLRPTALALPVLTALVLAACGGGSDDDGVASLGGEGADGEATSTTLSEEEREEAMLDWAACMREQGIDMPDPQVDGNGRTSVIIEEDDDDSADGGDGGDGGPPLGREEFEAALEECGEPPMLGGELSEEDREEMEERALALAECMRDNGVEDFPDPDFSESGPGAGPGTRTERFDDEDDHTAGDGEERVVIAGPFGEIDLSDPTTRAAFETCEQESGFGPPGGVGGGPGAAVAPAGGSS